MVEVKEKKCHGDDWVKSSLEFGWYIIGVLGVSPSCQIGLFLVVNRELFLVCLVFYLYSDGIHVFSLCYQMVEVTGRKKL